MIVRPTVMILGAGASKSYGFPTGYELKTLVLRNLYPTGQDVLVEYERMGCEPGDVKEFAEALRQSGVGSVDAFLEHREGFLNVGKTAIAQALIKYENEGSLFNSNSDWYGFVLDKLNAPLDRFNKNQLTILTFNYDRSLEWYIFRALQARFGVSDKKAIELIKQIPIIHLYGTLGGIPWDRNARPYDPSVGRSRIRSARDSIKIIHEGVGDDPEFGKAYTALALAQRIVFIGVGYGNRMNLQRLNPDGWNGADLKVFGSAFGMTDLEKTTASRHLGGRRELGKHLEFGRADWDALRFLREMVDFDGA